jgi:hypothetical protein
VDDGSRRVFVLVEGLDGDADNLSLDGELGGVTIFATT